MADNKAFCAFLKFLRPSFVPPNRRQLSGKLLDDKYKRIKGKVEEKIGSSCGLSCQLDGWTNIR